MPLYALDTILLGNYGAIARGAVVPTSYEDSLGAKHDTDFDRLRELGLVSSTKPEDPVPAEPDVEPVSAVEVIEAEPEPEPAPEPQPAPEPEPEPEAPEPVDPRPDLEKKKVAELRNIAEAVGVALSADAKKAEIIDALVKHATSV